MELLMSVVSFEIALITIKRILEIKTKNITTINIMIVKEVCIVNALPDVLSTQIIDVRRTLEEN